MPNAVPNKAALALLTALVCSTTAILAQDRTGNVTVNLTNRLGPLHIDHMALGQGGLSDQPMFADRVAELRALNPRLSRCDHSISADLHQIAKLAELVSRSANNTALNLFALWHEQLNCLYRGHIDFNANLRRFAANTNGSMPLFLERTGSECIGSSVRQQRTRSPRCGSRKFGEMST